MYSRRRSVFLSPVMIILYITIAILLAIYIGFVIFFQTHFLPNTIVGNVSCGFQTAEYVEETNEKAASRYSLMVTDRLNTLYVLKGTGFDYRYVNSGEAAKLLKEQNPLTWPAALFSTRELNLSYSVLYDESKLQSMIENLGIFHEDYIVKPENAKLEIKKDGYEIVPEVMGNEPIAEQISTEITDAVKSGVEALTLSSASYVTPSVYSTSEELTKAATAIDNYLKVVITYDIDGVDEVFDKDDIMSVLTVTAEYEVKVDDTKLERYVQSLATKYNTYGDVREFKTAKGDIVKIGGGDYGWIISKTKEAEQIKIDLANGKSITREPKWSQRAKVSGAYDLDDTYIEIDYTNQHAYYFKDGKIVLDFDIRSGNINKNWGSPDGIFFIKEKLRNRILVGEDYEAPVDYFITFAYNVGFHDSPSDKVNFGGEHYKTLGSHGCINTPDADVIKLFSMVEKGTPVVAYYREKVILSSESHKISNAYSYVKPENLPPEDTNTTTP